MSKNDVLSQKTKVILYHRHYGVHSFIKGCVIPVEFDKIYIKEDCVNEQLLADNLPDGFVPCALSKCLLTVEDEDRSLSTGQIGLSIFREWGKYFDSYSIGIRKFKPEMRGE